MLQIDQSPDASKATGQKPIVCGDYSTRAREKGDPTADGPSKKDAVLEALKAATGLNRFEAERIGDHCLNSTVATLRRSHTIRDEWETVPCRFSKKGVRVKRYYLEQP